MYAKLQETKIIITDIAINSFFVYFEKQIVVYYLAYVETGIQYQIDCVTNCFLFVVHRETTSKHIYRRNLHLKI